MFFCRRNEGRVGGKGSCCTFCIYRLRAATSGEIIEYAEKLRKNGKEVDIQIEGVNDALKNLERIGTIKLEMVNISYGRQF